jgi:hypothetical protein
MNTGDRVRVSRYPTHDDGTGGICQDCNLNGIEGTIKEFLECYIKVTLDQVPAGLAHSSPDYLFLAHEIEPIESVVIHIVQRDD